jgi:hypothetical protein
MRRAELGVVAALAVLALVVALLVPTYPNYDTYFHLVWGRELMHGMKPDFEAYAAPTEHPLFLALCAIAGLVGTDGERVIVLVCVLCLVALVWATFRVGDACFGPGRPWPAPSSWARASPSCSTPRAPTSMCPSWPSCSGRRRWRRARRAGACP